jgi:hypothetical protein
LLPQKFLSLIFSQTRRSLLSSKILWWKLSFFQHWLKLYLYRRNWPYEFILWILVEISLWKTLSWSAH